jgi:menaquinol-cytochrome c reductase iron-sulfur subunit
MGLGGAIAFAMGGFGLTYFLSPAWKKRQDGWVELGPLAEIPTGKPMKLDYILRKQDGWVTVEGRNSVWVSREGDDITVFSPNCTHLGCAYRWDDAKQSFMCPCHTGVFSRKGDVVSGPPPRPLDRFLTKVEGGSLFILPKEKTA